MNKIDFDSDDEDSQSSANLEKTNAFLPEYRKTFEAFTSANNKYQELLQDQRSTLLNARGCGIFLNRAKRLVKKGGGSWMDNVRKNFKGKARNAENYMQIAREWYQIEPLLKDHPDLSIDGALRYLRTGTVEKTKVKKGWDPVEFDQSRQWTQMLKETWRNWSKEEKNCIHSNASLFREMMEELRFTSLKRHFSLKEQKSILGGKKYKKFLEWQYAPSKRLLALRLQAVQSGRNTQLLRDHPHEKSYLI